MSPIPPSRYYLVPNDLTVVAFALQIGDSGLQAISNPLAQAKIAEAEDFAESEVASRVSVPLRPVRAPGQLVLPETLTNRNFPILFINGIKYWATGLLLQTSFSENAPAASEYGKWAMELALSYLDQFKDQATKSVGSGRMRHENPFMPPMLVQPREKPNQ